jgi:FAD/FMN-containing dehydrogenase
VLARGLGRSYGDAAVNGDGAVVLGERLARLLAFDENTGVLSCEAGVSFDDLIRTFLPRGWLPVVLPGTRFVTLGGAVAADVHGKNQHVDGTFGRHVEAIELVRPDGARVRASRDVEPELFRATLGGMGLTGIVLAVTFRMQRVTSDAVDVNYTRARDLDAAFESLERDARARYSVAWIDALARGRALGRSVVMAGDHARGTGPPSNAAPRTPLPVPFNAPSWLLGRWSVAAFNALYYRIQRRPRRRVPLEAFFHPLDHLGNWNRLYGRGGFFQYQALLPTANARQGVRELLEATSSSGFGSFLSVLKRCDGEPEGMLSFCRTGYTLALDLPNRGDSVRTLARDLDAIVLRHGGRVYLAKDALLDRQTFDAMVPEAEAFRDFRARSDPNRRLGSDLGRRLGLSGPR